MTEENQASRERPIDLKKNGPVCPRCKGTGYLLYQPDTGKPSKVIRCPKCTNYLSKTRLSENEQSLKVDDIMNRRKDNTGEPIVLRYMMQRMLTDPYGFFSLYGAAGSAKSMVLCILVAEFARQSKSSEYYTSEEIASGLRPSTYNFDKETIYMNNPEAFESRLKSVPVLAIDEIDKLLWTDYQIEKIGGIIDYRYRMPEHSITLLAMNRPPEEWNNASKLHYIQSRIRDGRFNRVWPSKFELPKCLEGFSDENGYYIPGFFETKLPDMRPFLRR